MLSRGPLRVWGKLVGPDGPRRRTAYSGQAAGQLAQWAGRAVIENNSPQPTESGRGHFLPVFLTERLFLQLDLNKGTVVAAIDEQPAFDYVVAAVRQNLHVVSMW